jgi:hypothetical protein
MSTTETRALIERAIERFGGEVPALKNLKIVIRLDLPSRGGEAVWRIELPGPTVSRDPAGDARLEVSVPRSHFNDLAEDGQLKHWADAYRRGHVKVSGDSAVVKLVGNVIERQLSRAGTTGLRGGGARPDG